MNKIALLHLSDLHISTLEELNISMIQEELIKDINKTTKKNEITIDFIVITGDLIDRGNIGAFVKVEEFVNKLLEVTTLPKERLFIVPGNHDIIRQDFYSDIANMIVENIKNLESADMESCWSSMKARFDSYHDFVTKYYGSDLNMLSYGMGARMCKVKSTNILFQHFNTSWLSVNNRDCKKLGIGRWQLECIRKERKKLCKPDIIITLSHHPFNWLTEQQETMVYDYLENENKLRTDIILHGHVHNAKLSTFGNPNHTIAELTSGIGYPEYKEREKGQAKVEGCRYSIYQFDSSKKNILCICRKSTNFGKFVADVTLYPSEAEDGIYKLEWNKQQLDNNIAITVMEKKVELELDPVPLAKGWSGRVDELDLISSDKYNAILISGVGGQGKTALASEYLRLQQSYGNYTSCIWADCRELKYTMQLKFQNIIETITLGKESAVKYKDELVEETITRFISELRKDRYLIVLDNVDAYVNIESEEFIGDLKLLINELLEYEISSKIILTCRIQVFDGRDNYKNLKLDGLKENDGLNYFRNRDISLDDAEDIELAKKLIQKTKGHPWWLGLIIGQAVNYESLKIYSKQYEYSMLSNNNRLSDFFGYIWDTLGKANKGKIGQELIRHLVESSEPLSINDISIATSNSYSKTSKVLNLLDKVGLIETHTDVEQNERLYHVHPLLREFVHNTYSVDKQSNYVKAILRLFLDLAIVNSLFSKNKNLSMGSPQNIPIQNIISSIDTCINSRNLNQALHLISNSYIRLKDEGRIQEYVSLSCRILMEIDWDKEQIVAVKNYTYFLSDIIEILEIMGQKTECNQFLKKYEVLNQAGTIPYSAYLSTKAFILWRREEYEDAMISIIEYEKMEEKESGLWCPFDVKYTKALVLRDRSIVEEDIEKALSIFSSDDPNSSDLGNMARCYQKLNNYKEAIENLNNSLKMLKKESNLIGRVNIGYAYLWLAEIYKANKDITNFNKYLVLCKKQWEEFAPGLLKLIKEV